MKAGLEAFPYSPVVSRLGKHGAGIPQRRTGLRSRKKLIVVSSEGDTERDYLRMNVFKRSDVSVRFVRDTDRNKRNPAMVLSRMESELKTTRLEKNDEAWVVIDVDTWPQAEIDKCIAWADSKRNYHIAISNPKIELFLVMHYESGNGCTTAERVDAAIRRHMPAYSKRLSRTHFDEAKIQFAVENASKKRATCHDDMPAPGVTDFHLLVEKLF